MSPARPPLQVSSLPIGVLLLALCLAACSGSDEQGSEEDTLRDLAWSVLSGVNDLQNQLVAGSPEGAQDRTGACPFGGEARVTGQTSVDESTGIEQVDLTWKMTGCRIAPVSASGDMHADIILDGTLTEKGSFSAPSTNKTYTAIGLRMVGSISRGESSTKVDRTCDVQINRKTSSVNALLCGTNVAW